jgi:type IV secretion system protein VirD4
VSKGPFDFSSELGIFRTASKWGRIGYKAGRHWKANQVRKQVEAEYDGETAEAVAAAISSGRNPQPILDSARRRKEERAERDQLLKSPPPLHGSAAWATPSDLKRYLKGRDGFDNPSSILLGTLLEDGASEPAGFVHWDGDGHLLTVAPTRSGKSVTTIIPNLLRYRGSAIVLDPKGELYEKTSAWRAANVGPVFRIAPFDDGSDPETAQFPRHGFNPLSRIRSQHHARGLAHLMFPRDPNGQEFFNDDAVSFLTGLIQFVLDTAPPERRNLGTVREAASAPMPARRERQGGAPRPSRDFIQLLTRMAASRLASVREAADNVLGKSDDRGIPNLRDTLNSKLSLWSDPALLAVTDRNDVDFGRLKEQPATVYITVPLSLTEAYAPFLKVLLKSALDALLENPAVPKIPVLFVLDEFLSLGPFADFRNAIRTHASAGVRLWFFLQDMGTLEEHYPGTSWHAFLNTSVKQFFGVDDPFTGELVGRYLGNQTVAYVSTQSGANVSAQMGTIFEDGSAGVAMSSGQSIQFLGRPLLTPDEVMALLSDWHANGTRTAVVHIRGPRAFKLRLVPYDKSEACRARIGAFKTGGRGNV